jgi:hypothetical protein
MKHTVLIAAMLIGLSAAAQEAQPVVSVTTESKIQEIKPIKRNRKIYLYENHVEVVTSTVFTREQYETILALNPSATPTAIDRRKKK